MPYEYIPIEAEMPKEKVDVEQLQLEMRVFVPAVMQSFEIMERSFFVIRKLTLALDRRVKKIEGKTKKTKSGRRVKLIDKEPTTFREKVEKISRKPLA